MVHSGKKLDEKREQCFWLGARTILDLVVVRRPAADEPLKRRCTGIVMLNAPPKYAGRRLCLFAGEAELFRESGFRAMNPCLARCPFHVAFEPLCSKHKILGVETRVGIGKIRRANVLARRPFFRPEDIVEFFLLLTFFRLREANVLLNLLKGFRYILFHQGLDYEVTNSGLESLAVAVRSLIHVFEDRLDIIDCVRNRSQLLH
ncbi:MAG: hypothetical protein JW395_3638 [Nitrospira sp.]|nr:hypothetical protein [Nitrospira sp.]